VLNDAREFALWLSPDILEGTARVLRQVYGWSPARTNQYMSVLERIAMRSGGAVIEPDETVTDCEDWEDNRILELASSCGAVLIVSSDEHLLRISPWRETPIVDPRSFVSKVDAMRRARRRIAK
jgi:predicted nucleic acid-binding protein